jgi:hypothetical protein
MLRPCDVYPHLTKEEVMKYVRHLNCKPIAFRPPERGDSFVILERQDSPYSSVDSTYFPRLYWASDIPASMRDKPLLIVTSVPRSKSATV